MKQNANLDGQEIDSKTLSNWLNDIAEKRDKQAFARLFKWFSPKILGFGRKQFNNPAMASELLQETMTNVWRKAHLYNQEKGAATTWVYTVMRNISFDMLRKVQANHEDTLSDDIWPLAEAQNSDEHVFADHLMDKQISQYLNRLPDNQRQIIQGVYFQDLSQEQLAKNLSIPLGTVKSRLRLALTKLRQHIGADND
ncbi:sigma-70 family RNA polymerase sigma factor [Pseudoalteromonas spongiae]|uniref:sigma-70 family RNA polymerase sigma factor n=1 Tax=Pseudoalteromonas spongiae TaxID=298657 RepID=UPI000C2D446D|nr:sigma-70 family RNA polymerase sigma factor [Pseudoalteromonas spongiae]